MIKRIFIFISKRLNSVIKFINIRILKRKKGMTFIEFIYLILSEFQKTIFYRVIIVVYKIMAVFLAFISIGIFYDNNYNFVNITDFLGKIKIIIIGIYKILYETIITLYKLVFKNKTTEEENIPEPYELF